MVLTAVPFPLRHECVVDVAWVAGSRRAVFADVCSNLQYFFTSGIVCFHDYFVRCFATNEGFSLSEGPVDLTRASFSVVCIPAAGFSNRTVTVGLQYPGYVYEAWISFAAPAQGWDIWECCIYVPDCDIACAFRYVSCYSDDFFI